MIRRWAACVAWLVAACGGDHGGATDAAPGSDAVDAVPVVLGLLILTEPYDSDVPSPFDVLVDGEPATPSGALRVDVRRTFPSYQAALDSGGFSIEVLVGATVLTTRTEMPGQCVDVFGDSDPLEEELIELCIHDNGELRELALECTFLHSAGAADAFCTARCLPSSTADSCGDDKCGLEVKSADPYYAHLGCVPAGVRAVGEACTVDADGHDDCVEGAGCFAGACRAWCALPFGDCGELSCAEIPHNPEPFGVCM